MIDRSEARKEVWKRLISIAKPDSRFHFDFSNYITDFEGSDMATVHLVEMDIYKKSNIVFITPDNCLEILRAQTIRDQKVMLMTTYGIRRGFIELLPSDVPPGLEDYAILLDVVERMGRYISLSELRSRYQKIDLLVTGASAVTLGGVRFGKGHGFFDLEWAMLYQLGVVDTLTPMVALVHDCQVVSEELDTTAFDTVCDYVITPSQVISIENAQKPTTGVIWDRLEPNMLEDISPLKELAELERTGLI
jgi:5-formyltetrahydrofolate cyclo-ligase